MNDQSRKDDLITFEELGIDRLFIDESHFYKNLFLYTKMRNVSGITQHEAQKSSDLFMKCRYMDELTGGRGIVFATGTPISNSMVELYTIQRYLQYNTLVKHGLHNFDAWASTFGETITAVELTPEGTGYRTKTRFAKFYNLPELMSMFKEIADIKTADMLNSPLPEAHFHNIVVKPSALQKDMVATLGERAEKIRNGQVNSSVDNMLLITNDGRKLALDLRLINSMLPDEEDNKVNVCVNTIYDIWNKTAGQKSTQLLFCDLSTPKSDGSFSIYNDIQTKLIARGIPAYEIAFIHSAKTESQKQELFRKVRTGDVRILLGSTFKMGAGTNIQDKLIALHNIDCPWRPSDLEQRLGRIVRQGNENDSVDIYHYVTEETFDAYLYQLIEGKQKFVSQIMTSKSPSRSAEDIDETALSYAEIKMLATGNPHIKEKMDLDVQVQKLKIMKSSYLSEKYSLEDKLLRFFPQQISALQERISHLQEDVSTLYKHQSATNTFAGIQILGITYTDKVKAKEALLESLSHKIGTDSTHIGSYMGFDLYLSLDRFYKDFTLEIKGKSSRKITLGNDIHGNLVRVDNALEKTPVELQTAKIELENMQNQKTIAEAEVQKPFLYEDELKEKTTRLDTLNILMNMDEKVPEVLESEPDMDNVTPKKERDCVR